MSETSSHRAAWLGSLCLIAGVALAVLVVAVRLEGLWHLPMGLLRRNPVLMLAFSVVLILTGSQVLWQLRSVITVWTPTRPGRRFNDVNVYSKPDCSLCDVAKAVLADYQPYLPPIRELDVTTDAGLLARYGGCVPVVEIDGRKRFTGQINEVLLRRLIEGAPPQAR